MSEQPVELLLKTTKIFEIINPRLIQAPPSISIQDAITLMQEKNSSYVVLADQQKIVGIFTESDVLKKILGKEIERTQPASHFMTKDPYVLSPNDSVGEAMDIMGKHRLFHIPLTDGKGELCGILTVKSVINFLAECYPTEVYNLPPDPSQIMESVEGG